MVETLTLTLSRNDGLLAVDVEDIIYPKGWCWLGLNDTCAKFSGS